MITEAQLNEKLVNMFRLGDYAVSDQNEYLFCWTDTEKPDVEHSVILDATEFVLELFCINQFDKENYVETSLSIHFEIPFNQWTQETENVLSLIGFKKWNTCRQLCQFRDVIVISFACTYTAEHLDRIIFDLWDRLFEY